jgi:hypothetical protein
VDCSLTSLSLGAHHTRRPSMMCSVRCVDIAEGTVSSRIHRRHRAAEFKKFLVTIDDSVSAQFDVHLICDNLATPQNPCYPRLAGQTSGLPRAVHPDRVVLDQPSRALVWAAHRSTAQTRRPQKRYSTGKRYPPTGTKRNRSPGQRPPTRSSTPQTNISQGFPTQGTKPRDRYGSCE